MKLSFIEIKNFRKLKSCRVEIGDSQTVFVGANNSGKTSAMHALILFLTKDRKKRIACTDFTLSNWQAINAIGEAWTKTAEPPKEQPDLESWKTHLPAVDVWMQIEESKLQYVSHLIPSLDWKGGLLGFRLLFQPEDIAMLFKDYREAFLAAKLTQDAAKAKKKGKQSTLKLWPDTLHAFLTRNLHKYFAIKIYILDPEKCEDCVDGIAKPQTLPVDHQALPDNALKGLFKIDIITAHRGFTDPQAAKGDEDDDNIAAPKSARSLSTQFRKYYTKHLSPSDLPDDDDIEALEAIEAAQTAFDEKLHDRFGSAIGELQQLNYPGFSDPHIKLTSKLNPVESLDHDAAVQFNVYPEGSPGISLYLPENYNGLGYQNLISMVFNLIRFRDNWMLIGKAGKRNATEEEPIPPLHLVLIEEPEAHLHAQVQQVFVKKAMAVLRNHPLLGNKTDFNTQLIISTHSSHIAHEIDFTTLRYFRRRILPSMTEIPCASVVNLSKTFGDGSDTSKFAARYIKTTHCDLFFADAVILIEGAAERILLPHFIKCSFEELDKSYITVLEIAGSHAHRLQPLLNNLGLPTLIITDVDTIEEKTRRKSIPKRGAKLRTGNYTLNSWIPKKEGYEELLGTKTGDKESGDGGIRVTYQTAIEIQFKKDAKKEELLASTFEDALVFANLELFRNPPKDDDTTIAMFAKALSEGTLAKAQEAVFGLIKADMKAELALDLLFFKNPKEIKAPEYIAEGLNWLIGKLRPAPLLSGKVEEDHEASKVS